MRFQQKHREELELNMTSLIDVVLLLLIFFMMSTKFIDESRLQVRLPEAGVAARRGIRQRSRSRSR